MLSNFNNRQCLLNISDRIMIPQSEDANHAPSQSMRRKHKHLLYRRYIHNVYCIYVVLVYACGFANMGVLEVDTAADVYVDKCAVDTPHERDRSGRAISPYAFKRRIYTSSMFMDKLHIWYVSWRREQHVLQIAWFDHKCWSYSAYTRLHKHIVGLMHIYMFIYDG